MQFLFISLLYCLGIWATARGVAGFIEEQCLLEPHRRYLKERFEDWWFKVAAMGSRDFAVAIARSACVLLDGFFGKRLLSGLAFKRASILGTGLLAASLAGMSLVGGGIKPWEEFDESIAFLKSVPERMAESKKSTETKDTAVLFADDYITKAIAFNTTQWKFVYTIVYIFILVVANAFAFALSVALSRLILNEIVLSGRIFSALSLLTLNLLLIFLGGIFAMLFLLILSQPFFWPIFIEALSLPFIWLIIASVAAGIFAWWVAEYSAISLCIVATVPFLVAGFVCIASSIGLLSREKFHAMTSWFLLCCTEKKPLSFVVGFFGLNTILVAAIYRLIAS